MEITLNSLYIVFCFPITENENPETLMADGSWVVVCQEPPECSFTSFSVATLDSPGDCLTLSMFTQLFVKKNLLDDQ